MHSLLAVRLAMVCNMSLSNAHEDEMQVQSVSLTCLQLPFANGQGS